MRERRLGERGAHVARVAGYTSAADCSTPRREARTRRKSVRRQCTATYGWSLNARATYAAAALYTPLLNRTYGRSGVARPASS